jgi:hypothetical protein
VGDGVGAPNRIELVQMRGDVKLGSVDGDDGRAITLFDAPLGLRRDDAPRPDALLLIVAAGAARPLALLASLVASPA